MLRGVAGVEAELQDDDPGQAEVVAQPVHRGRDDAEVLGDQRQLAERRAPGSNSARPGPRCQRPPSACFAPFGTAQ